MRYTTIRDVWPELQKLFGLQHLEHVTHCCIEMGVDCVTTITATMLTDATTAEPVTRVFEVVERSAAAESTDGA